ncbi:GNAT family N-acetyltransferase [Mesorhizobium sp. L-8-3]|uniref:GNAT family N-acetyltransferase n=1 Tax=Mesorhizobium sp. L-8-3 TaxID=2744522 RepID=UPI001928284B|nr:GNAT family N-acetyltransferase [Mesorhizobium sp. L-8-3]BCH22566.1 N-acetyltransferase [Mesorhizobium sp. L-8-3]
MADIASTFQFEETAKGGRYFLFMPNGEESRLTFVKAASGHIIADHTFVPVPYRGDGVAEALVERLVADARAAGNKITPTCWFVADEFKRHSPAWDDVLKA